MPTRALLPCRAPQCPALVERSGYCPAHQKAVYQRQDERRGTAASRGYDSRWAKARKTYLTRNPLCVTCSGRHIVRAATVVDHIIPHRGDQKLFWDVEGNWQALCKRCHDSKTARESAFGRDVDKRCK